MLLIVLHPDRWRPAVLLLVSAATVLVVGSALALMVGRTGPHVRIAPFDFHPLDVGSRLFRPDSLSFPSVPVSLAFVTAAVLSHVLPRGRWLFFGSAVLVGTGRVAELQHYVSDVIAAALVGVTSFHLALALFNRVSRTWGDSATQVVDKPAGEQVVPRALTAAIALPAPGIGHSYAMTRDRFDQASSAALYATRHGGHARDRREQRCIELALQVVPRGSRVLDLPCGAGRLAPMLQRLGFQVTEADASAHMVERARSAWNAYCLSRPSINGSIRFEVRDVMSTGFPDDSFDAVICNRLLHHYVESRTRTAALRELARITRGPVIVSFFSAASLDAIWFWLKNAIYLRVPDDRVPITLGRLLRDAQAADLKLNGVFQTRWGISPQTYLRLVHR
jgi:SAM-dependent methyltransferase